MGKAVCGIGVLVVTGAGIDMKLVAYFIGIIGEYPVHIVPVVASVARCGEIPYLHIITAPDQSILLNRV